MPCSSNIQRVPHGKAQILQKICYLPPVMGAVLIRRPDMAGRGRFRRLPILLAVAAGHELYPPVIGVPDQRVAAQIVFQKRRLCAGKGAGKPLQVGHQTVLILFLGVLRVCAGAAGIAGVVEMVRPASLPAGGGEGYTDEQRPL